MNIFSDLLDLIYPPFCPACDEPLLKNEDHICTKCLLKMPRSEYAYIAENPLEMIFWGRTILNSAASFVHFSKGGRIQKIIHDLKYRGNTKAGIKMGRIFGSILEDSDRFSTIDFVIPVPLHKKKLKKRGYNQSSFIAEGIGISMDKEIVEDNLVRIHHSDTQTKKNRIQRWENVENIFHVNDPKQFENKHILLVDDIITTGATIEACCQALHQSANMKISVVCLASLV